MRTYKQFIEEGKLSKLAQLAQKAAKVVGKAVKSMSTPHSSDGNISKV